MVSQIKKILFATDLSENSRRAFRYAATMAERYEADMVLVHVMEEIPSRATDMIRLVLGEDTWRQVKGAREQHARSILIGKKTDHLAIRKALADFYGKTETGEPTGSFEDYEIDIRDGQVAKEILAAADDHDCQVVVVGTHGRALGETALGSVVMGVLHHAKIPVLVVPPQKEA